MPASPEYLMPAMIHNDFFWGLESLLVHSQYQFPPDEADFLLRFRLQLYCWIVEFISLNAVLEAADECLLKLNIQFFFEYLIVHCS